MSGGVEAMSGGAEVMSGGVEAMPGGVEAMSGGVEAMSGGVEAMPGGMQIKGPRSPIVAGVVVAESLVSPSRFTEELRYASTARLSSFLDFSKIVGRLVVLLVVLLVFVFTQTLFGDIDADEPPNINVWDAVE